MKRIEHEFLALVILPLAILVFDEQRAASQSDNGGESESEVMQVFPPPSQDELSVVEHPALRLELLKMVSEDQTSRSEGT